MKDLIKELSSAPLVLALAIAAAKSSIIFLLAWIVSVFLRGRSAALRHILWITASASSLALLVLPSALPAWKIMPRFSAPPASVYQTPQTIAEPNVSSETIAPSSGVPGNAGRIAPAQKSSHIAASALQKETVTTSITSSAANTPVSLPLAPLQTAFHADAAVFALVLWPLGIFCCLISWIVGAFRLRGIARNAIAVTERAWMSATDRTAATLNVQRPIAIWSSAEIEIPITFGMIHPKIVLPADYPEWNAQRREAVLRHEIAHIARWDALTHHISQIACAVYWFNPLAWLAARSARFERELACDNHVLASGTVASEYAGELLTMVSRFQRREHYAAALAMARRSQFEGRLVALLDPRQSRKGVSRHTALVALIVAATVALPLAAMAPQDAATSAPTAKDRQGNTVTYSPDAPVSGVPGGVDLGVAGGADNGVNGRIAGGVQGDVNTKPSEQDSIAPHAEAQMTPQPTPAPDAFEPFAPAAERLGISQPSPAAFPALARQASGSSSAFARSETTPSPSGDNKKSEHPAVMPPAARQTGLECVSTGSVHHNSQMSTNDDGNLKSMVVNWSSDDCSVSLNSRGEIKFTDDFTAIQSLSQDGFVEINSRIHGDTRRLSIHPTSNNGPLEYVWWVNGNKQPFDDAARKWVAGFLIELDRHSAWAVKQRFPALMREGGVNRVLDEVSYMGSDYARSIYLMTLVNDVDLKPRELTQTLALTSELSSDYETARVLMAIAGKYPLQDQASRNAFLAAIDGITSDYEHARVLMAFFNKGPIPVEMARAVLSSASRLKSDYEHSRILVEMANRGLVDANTQMDFLASVNQIKSDYEHSRSLIAFLQSRKSDDAAVLGVIKAASDIHSDYEAARVLTTVASGRNLTGTLRDEYIRSAQHIGSPYERNRALAAIAYRATSL